MSQQILSLQMVKVPVHDVVKAAVFYSSLPTFEQQFVVGEYGWAQFMVGALPFALYEPGKGGGNRTPGGSVDFHLASPDLDALHEQLKAQNIPMPEGIVSSADGGRFLEITDPDQNILKIIAS